MRDSGPHVPEWRLYHDATRHSPESLRRNPHFLDWANMPDPFRHYEGVPLLDLPADPPGPTVPALSILQGASGIATASTAADFLSQLLFYAAAISASKLVPSTGYRYALRVNPSSGNLHPTEFHFITRGLEGWPDGLYHYRPSSHMAEQRARGRFRALGAAPVTFILTSIAWREAWKYRDRAYRYCLLDIGHAWESLALAARALGCTARASGDFADDEISVDYRLSPDEWPMLQVTIEGPAIPCGATDASETEWFGGEPNRLSHVQVEYPLIDRIHAATKRTAPGGGVNRTVEERCPGIPLGARATSSRRFGEVVRARRSALDFTGGANRIPLDMLSAILDAAARPLAADFATVGFVSLFLYVHRVEGLEPGVYRHWPGCGRLELVRAGDQRVAAAGLSLGQDLAGNACFAISMIADLVRATGDHGDRGYRYVHMEAGAIGQRLYVAAESLGLRGTGIGAFFDDRVQDYLRIPPDQGRVIYHFAIGYPVEDPRLEA